ncbi:MAG: imelysin family protein [Crocinitomicaceae bacterium]|nr:imelysin family protein [Crocinitomicaceae bacterium]
MNKLISTILIALFLFSCKENNKDVQDYDRVPMLTNIADNIIIPNYEAMATDLNQLKASLDSLNANMTQTWLDSVKFYWYQSYSQWQYCKVFEIGPASDYALRSSMNTFPTDTSLIESNISNGSYTLGSLGNIQAIGFPALDYLLYADSDADILNRIATSANFRQYLADVVEKMATDVNLVLTQWTTSYRNSFVASTGSASGSSTNNLYNALIFDLELIKNAKYGIPLGKDILDVARPTYVEALYSGISNHLARENMTSIEDVFLGRDLDGNDGVGFDDYLDFVGAKRGAEDLSLVIKNQFANLETEMMSLPDPLSNALSTNYSQIDNLYFSIRTQVLYMKTDMSSALGLLIEFDSNDGD